MALPSAARRLASLDFTEWRRGVERMLAELDNRVARVGGRDPQNVYPAGTVSVVGANPPEGTPVVMKIGTVVVAPTTASGDISFALPTPFANGIVSIVSSPGDDTANFNVVRWLGSGATTLSTLRGRAITNAGYVGAGSGIRVNYIACGW